MAEQKKYDKEFKVEAVKLSREIGRKKPQKNWAYRSERFTAG